MTQERVWLGHCQRALAERPKKSDQTRLEICAAGYRRDREAIKSIDDWSFWIYVASQGALASLVAMETDASLRAQ